MSEFHTLQWASVSAEQLSAEQQSSMVESPQQLLDWHQPAEHVVERLDSAELLRLPMSLTVAEAEHFLTQSDRRYAVVIDTENKPVGMLLARVIRDRHSHVMANLLQIAWQELTVGYLMTPMQRLPAIMQKQLASAKIGDIAATMQDSGSDFLLIINELGLHGIVVSLKVLAVTGESIRLYPKATSFADVFNVIKHSER